MSRSFHRNIASAAAVNGARIVAFATLVLAASAFIPAAPTAATSHERATYCLSSDSENDCGFTSLGQCQATASGGLGVCTMMPAWWQQRDRYAARRLAPKSRG